MQWPARLRNQTGPPGTDLWPEPGEFRAERFVGFTQVYTFPSLTWTSSLQWTNRFEIKDDFSYSAGRHQWKFGGAHLRFISPEDSVANLGTWTFSQDQFFDASAAAIANLRSARLFTASFPSTTRKLQQYWYNAFAQDEWRVRSNLTLNLGLRYEIQYHSFNYNFDFTGRERLHELIDPKSRGNNGNLAPRIGLAWDVRDDGRTVGRLAYGRFYQYVSGGSMRNEADTLKQNSISITNPSYPDPYGGLSPQAFISVAARPNVAILDDNIENGFGDTVTAGVSQQLRTNLAIHVDGVYTNLHRLARTQNINQPRPAVEFTTLDAATAARLTTLTTAQLNAARPMATWGNINQLASNGWHDYRALYLRLDKRFSDGYQYIVSYTRDWTENNVGTISDYYHPELNTGPNGRKHSVVASGSARLPYELTLGAVWTIRSALPFGAMAGVDLTGTGTVSMVPGTSRNMGGHDSEGTASLLEAVNAWRGVRGLSPIPESQIQSSDYNRFDVRVSRSFALRGSQRVELMFQVLNVFGRDNLIGGTGGNFIDNSLSNGYGTYTVAAPRQEAEVGVTFSF